jgi:divalent metal cation (Fe/Co/Zn/Cd) transporter
MKKENREVVSVTVLVVMALAVGVLWTVVFGSYWQWLPILAGCGIGLLVVRIGNAGHPNERK